MALILLARAFDTSLQNMLVAPVTVFVLDGQGIAASNSPQTLQIAQRDSCTPVGSTVLLACYQALRRDLDTLRSDEQQVTGIAVTEEWNPAFLLKLASLYPGNAIVENTHLVLLQLLRWAANTPLMVASDISEHTDSSSFVGFSSGILAATAIACARDIPTFVQHAVSIFRLSFWIGLRAQQYSSQAVAGLPIGDVSATWNLVTFGSTRSEIEEALTAFNMEQVH